MKWFRNLNTAVKIISSFLVIILIIVGFGIYSLQNLSESSQRTDQVYSNNLISVQKLSSVQIYYQRLRVNLRDLNTANSEERRQTYLQKITELKQNITTNLNEYTPLASTTIEQKELAKVESAYHDYIKLFDEAVRLAQIPGSQAQAAYITYKDNTLKPAGDLVSDQIDQLILINNQLAQQASIDAKTSYTDTRQLTIIILIAITLFSLLLSYLIARTISQPLKQLSELIAQFASGDLSGKSDINTKDEVGRLSASVNTMADNLRDLISRISLSAQSVAASSEQISATTEEIANTNSSQAESASRITELFKELSSAIDSVATSASEAAELSNETMERAHQGGQVVNESLLSMQNVNDSIHRLEEDSQRIGDIIVVIDDIANQTNLLALNAAIEAARAGEQGKGFAVVADEVRKLAERSIEATKQISGIIKTMQRNTRDSVVSVKQSTEQSNETNASFQKIVHIINDSALKVNDIAAACEEEAAQAAEVMLSVETIAAASEQSAAAAQQTAASSHSLAKLAEELNDSVSLFKV